MKTQTRAKAIHERYKRETSKGPLRTSAQENEVKAQHFVQKAYLEGFCDTDTSQKTDIPMLWVHSADGRWRQNPVNCAVEKYFYCHDPGDGSRSFLGETFLSDLENASMEVLKAAQQGQLPTCLKDRLTLTGYVAMALVRTQAAKKLMDKAAIDMTVQGIRDLVNDPVRLAEYCAEQEKETGKREDPDEVRRVLQAGRVCATQTSRSWSLKTMATQMMYFQNMFMRMNLVMVRADNAQFATSDCPVKVANPVTIPILPKGMVSWEMVFPLSRQHCLVGTYSEVSHPFMDVDESQVKYCNIQLARHANRFVYSPVEADYIQTELKCASTQRDAGSDIIQF